jgi:ATP-dependent DNA helicase PIF1
LEGDIVSFEARDGGIKRDKLDQQCIAPEKLEIKEGAQVMLLKNQKGGATGLVNGSIGKVIGFVSEPADNFRIGRKGERLRSLNKDGELLPKVKFENGCEMVLGREEWTSQSPNGQVLWKRAQIPLCLAWAISIHKSQGQTYSKLSVNLSRSFAKGEEVKVALVGFMD